MTTHTTITTSRLRKYLKLTTSADREMTFRRAPVCMGPLNRFRHTPSEKRRSGLSCQLEAQAQGKQVSGTRWRSDCVDGWKLLQDAKVGQHDCTGWSGSLLRLTKPPQRSAAGQRVPDIAERGAVGGPARAAHRASEGGNSHGLTVRGERDRGL